MSRSISASDLRGLLTELQQTRQLRHCSALIDIARFAENSDCAKALAMDAAAFDLLPNVYEGFAPTLMQRGPRLVTAPLHEPVWQRISELAVRQQTASFLFHDCAPGILRAHLKSLVRAKQPDGSKRLFRFQDSTVLSSVAPLLTVTQTHSVLGPAECWLVLDVCSHPVQLQRRPASTLRAVPLRLSKTQVDDLEIQLRPASIIAQANEVDAALLHGRTRCEQWQMVRSAMRRATEHGLQFRDDVALFCILSFQLPDGFDRDGPVAAALQRTRRGGLTFGQAIDEVPIKEWRAWDEELDAMEVSS